MGSGRSFRCANGIGSAGGKDPRSDMGVPAPTQCQPGSRHGLVPKGTAMARRRRTRSVAVAATDFFSTGIRVLRALGIIPSALTIDPPSRAMARPLSLRVAHRPGRPTRESKRRARQRQFPLRLWEGASPDFSYWRVAAQQSLRYGTVIRVRSYPEIGNAEFRASAASAALSAALAGGYGALPCLVRVRRRRCAAKPVQARTRPATGRLTPSRS